MISSSIADSGLENISQKHPELYSSLNALLRSKPDTLDAYLERVECDVAIPSTHAQAHCYLLALDGNKRPRVNDFARYIATRITDFAIPRTEIIRAITEDSSNKSTAAISALNMKARNLFTKLPRSGEGGEVLLSVLAETFLQLPQLFTKMVLKTNAEMHIHGSDGIHVTANPNTGNLAIYWGESKLHQTATSAVNSCFSSLAPFLLDAGGSGAVQNRDLQLMRDGVSLDNPELVNALKHYLDPNDPMFKKMEYRGLCLVGFDSDSYPTSPNSKNLQELKNEIQKAFDRNKSTILNRISEEGITTFVIEVFCLPFPSIEDFRVAFRSELGLNRE